MVAGPVWAPPRAPRWPSTAPPFPPTVSETASKARLPIVHVYVYDALVKRRELESRLRDLGWTFLRHGGSHDVWTDGERLEYLPRHAEINEHLARKILKKAQTKKETDS